MKLMQRIGCRAVHLVLHLVLPLEPFSEPRIVHSVDEVPELLRDRDVDSVLLVTGPHIHASGLTDRLVERIGASGISCTVYSKTRSNPTVDDVEEAYALYRAQRCTAVIGFGGGSAMDCAKGVAARAAQPKKDITHMKGLLRVHKPTPPLVAVPTTAGSGSEVTLAAVITDSSRNYKYVIEDFALIPGYAVLDPALTVGTSPGVTAACGMDALTHAVEAYIGHCTYGFTRSAAEEAVVLIHDNLYDAYTDGTNLEARRAMQRAAYQAGNAFTRSYVGYVHGIAHSLGGRYGISHGLACAVVLPHMLRAYGSSCTRPLARLARLAGIAGKDADTDEAADAFIAWIDEMNRSMGIPRHLDCIRREDIPEMASRAARESNPLYPVPRLMDKSELAHMYEVVAGWDECGAEDGTAA